MAASSHMADIYGRVGERSKSGPCAHNVDPGAEAPLAGSEEGYRTTSWCT